jgi:hypothetical protein
LYSVFLLAAEGAILWKTRLFLSLVSASAQSLLIWSRAGNPYRLLGEAMELLSPACSAPMTLVGDKRVGQLDDGLVTLALIPRPGGCQHHWQDTNATFLWPNDEPAAGMVRLRLRLVSRRAFPGRLKRRRFRPRWFSPLAVYGRIRWRG